MPSSAFYNCTKLSSVVFHKDIPNSISSNSFTNIYTHCIVKYSAYAQNISNLTGLFSQQEILPNSERWVSNSRVFEGINSNDGGGICTLNRDGSIMAFGIRGIGKGEVRVYEKNTTTLEWDQIGSTINTTLQSGGRDSNFGSSLSLSNDGKTVSIGAESGQYYLPGVSPGAEVGTVEVFSLNTSNSTWELKGQPILGQNMYNSAHMNDINGDGDILIVGEMHYSTAASTTDPYTYDTTSSTYKQGRARVFKYNSVTSMWELLGNHILGAKPQDYFGKSVSISRSSNIGDLSSIHVIIGAVKDEPPDNENFLDYGSSRIYQFDTTTNDWQQKGETIYGGSGSNVLEECQLV